jgi:nucleoside phosphorylase
MIAPTEMEYGAIRRTLESAHLLEPAGKIRLSRCGVGEEQSAAFCRQLDAGQISCLALVGWAGGLVPDLPVGAVVCANAAVKEGQPTLACQALTLADSRTGPILTSPVVLLTPEEKETAQTGGALAVEMEAYPMADWAAQNGVPFFHVRIILDSFEETLPETGSFQDGAGRLHPGSLVMSIIRRPALVKSLAQLSRRVRELDPALGRLARECAEQLT